MSLVTDQGKQEQQRVDELVTRLSEDVLAIVDQGEIAPAAVLDREQAQPADLVREAIWKLLDERKIEFTKSRLLRRPSA